MKKVYMISYLVLFTCLLLLCKVNVSAASAGDDSFITQKVERTETTQAVSKTEKVKRKKAIITELPNFENKSIVENTDAALLEGSLTITVLEKGTEEKVPEVVVAFLDVDGNELAEEISDENGNIFIEHLLPGSYVARIKEFPQGYKQDVTTSASVYVRAGKMVTGTLKVIKNGVLEITVIDNTNGMPVPGVSVVVKDSTEKKILTDQTDDTGKLVANNLVPGTYCVEVLSVPEGYLKEDQTIVETQVAEGERKSESLLVAKEILNVCSLDIRIVQQETNDPISGAKVQVVYPDGKECEYVTDSAGKILLSGLYPGEYSAEILGLPERFAVDSEEVRVQKIERDAPAEFLFEVRKMGILEWEEINTEKQEPDPLKDHRTLVLQAIKSPKNGESATGIFVEMLLGSLCLLTFYGLKRGNKNNH